MDLVVSDYDGKNVKTVFPNIQGYEVIDHNTLLVTQMVGDKKEVSVYNLMSDTKTRIDTQIPTL
jgi:hypothetical protein